jgi:hypothetical protein
MEAQKTLNGQKILSQKSNAGGIIIAGFNYTTEP